MFLYRLFFLVHFKVIFVVGGLLLSPLLFFSQDVTGEIQDQFNQYRKEQFQEKLFLHTDKSFYLTGEIIWFKIYSVDGYFHQPLDLNKVAYIEIITKDKKPILQSKIALEEGFGSGSLRLPASVNSGNYLIRCYTSWMKNMGVDFFYEKIITIANPLKASSPVAPTNTAPVYDFQFFPEGGNLVNGLESKVAFHVKDMTGRGVSGKGFIINQKNDTITRFKTSLFGIGNFLFTPQKGNKYKGVLILSDNTLLSKDVATAYDKGWTMRLSGNDSIGITVSISNTSQDDNSMAILFVHTRQSKQLLQKKIFSNGKAEFIILQNSLPEGVTHFTVFNEKKQAVCERLFFKAPAKNLRLSIETDQKVYSPRRKVSVQLNAINHLRQSAAANLSVSVFLTDSLQKADEPTIVSYLYLNTDLAGKIESPDYYFTGHPQSSEAAENLMLTKGWRRFRWENVFNEDATQPNYLPEAEGHQVTGRVIDSKSKLPVANISVSLSIPGAQFQLQNAISDATGILRFNLKKIYGANEVILTGNQYPVTYQLDIVDPFSSVESPIAIPEWEFPEHWKEQLLHRSIAIQAENIYSSTQKEQFSQNQDPDTVFFYGHPYKRYFLDDFTRFLTMQEVIQEYITEVRLKKIGDRNKIELLNLPYKSFFDNEPLILLDGVPVSNTDKIIAFDPLKIKAVDVVPNKYFRGANAEDGVVSFHTFSGDLAGFPLDSSSLLVSYEGLQLQREFYSPLYENIDQQESRIPDFRNLLFWSPKLKTKDDGKTIFSFYTSDLPGTYTIVVNAITSAGLVGSEMATIRVNKNP
jgi:hypothetical protein